MGGDPKLIWSVSDSVDAALMLMLSINRLFTLEIVVLTDLGGGHILDSFPLTDQIFLRILMFFARLGEI